MINLGFDCMSEQARNNSGTRLRVCNRPTKRITGLSLKTDARTGKGNTGRGETALQAVKIFSRGNPSAAHSSEPPRLYEKSGLNFFRIWIRRPPRVHTPRPGRGEAPTPPTQT